MQGDSYTLGWGLSTAETFASHLDLLASEASGGRLRVVNLGGGYGTYQQCARIAALFVARSANDAADSLAHLGYHLGMWRNRPLSPERSRLHLANFWPGEMGTSLDESRSCQLRPPLQPAAAEAAERGDRGHDTASSV